MRDAVEVFEQIKRANRTLRKLPPAVASPKYCNWPDIIRSFYEVWRDGVTTPPRLGATSKQITEMDEVIRWMAWLSHYGEEYTRIIWARAENRSWRKIAATVGLGKDTCRERFRIGVYALCHALESRLITNN